MRTERQAIQRRPTRALDPIIGRADELEAVLHQLEVARLVSLTAVGGTGKTRLALEVVDQLARQGGEAWFVDLSSLTDASQIDGAIVAAMEIEVVRGQAPRDALHAFLIDRTAILVLDNVEQIVDAARLIDDLLATAPSVRILVTSRVPVGSPTEVEIKLAALDVPPNGTPASVGSSASGALFLRRARAHGGVDGLDDQLATTIADLLRRLDGLPLAIELAAARTKLITPHEILDRVDRLGIAAIDRPVAGAEESLRGILEWTTGLLAPDELQLLEAASVTAGFDLRLAEALVPEADALETLDGLLDAGLVHRTGEVARTTRFNVLETVRSFVRGRTFEESAATYLRRLALATADWIEEVASLPQDDDAHLAQLDAEADNLRRTFDWFDEHDPTRGLHLWNLIFYSFWARQGRLREGMQRFERSAEMLDAPNVELAQAMVRYAMNQLWVSDETTTRAAMSKAVELARTVGDTATEIEALAAMAAAATNEGDRELAIEVLDRLAEVESDTLSAELRMRIAEARHHSAATVHGQASDEATSHLLEAISFAEDARQPRVRAVLTGNLALARLHRQEFELAVEAGSRAVELCRSTGSPLLAWAMCALAMALAGAADAEASRRVLAEAIAATERTNMAVQTCDTLLASLPVAVASAQPVIAARIWGAVTAMEAAGQAEIPPDDRLLAERSLHRLRGMLSAVELELATRAGAAEDPMSLLRLLPEALAGTHGRALIPSPRLRHAELTQREVEVLRFVAKGLNDAQIAEALFISPKTASVHVSNVKGKLGAASRVEVALRALELGIVEGAEEPS